MDQEYHPELYSGEDAEALEAHIQTQFGDFKEVFHELISPDIHVDIAIIAPSPERDYYTLVTMGMGAHQMHVPEELREEDLDRAELLITLPPDWELKNQEEVWYWPLRWLKIMARLPGNHDTWLGWGHTVPAGEPVAENTQLCGMLVLNPGDFAPECTTCQLPGGDVVNFYQIIPLYQEELDYKITHGTEALLELMPDEALMVVRPDRPNCCAFVPRKEFATPAEELEQLLTDWEGPDGCFATDRILVDGCPVGYMYREEPEENMPDSGWRFLAGDETEEYMDDPGNSGIYVLNTVCNSDPEIIPFLGFPVGSAFYRDEEGRFQLEADE